MNVVPVAEGSARVPVLDVRALVDPSSSVAERLAVATQIGAASTPGSSSALRI